MKSLSILFADDEEDIRNIVRHWLEAEGHRMAGAGSAREAKVLMAQQTFDLVITDVLMPDGDGIDLIRETRRLQPATPILAVSGGGRYFETDDCLKVAVGLGAQAAVTKPFARAQFLAGIAAALAPVRSDASAAG